MTPCDPSAASTIQPARTARLGAADSRSTSTRAMDRPASSQPMSAWNWVTPSRGSGYRGTPASPASGPVPVTTVPAVSIRQVTATSAADITRRSRRTGVASGIPDASASAAHRMCSATAAATTAAETRKCTETVAGLSLVSTTIPPITACATTPSGWAAPSHTRSRRRWPSSRNRQAAMKISAAMITSGKFSSLLPNSIQVLSRVCPAFLLATTSAALHCGQSGQPSPDALSRTAAPVDMITVSAMTPASASRRIETGVGASTGLVQAATRDLRSTSTPLMVERSRGARGVWGGGQPPKIGGFRGDQGFAPPGKYSGPGAGHHNAADGQPLHGAQVLAEQAQPDQRRHRRLQAHPHAEQPHRYPPQRLELEPVGDDGGQDPDRGADSQHGRPEHGTAARDQRGRRDDDGRDHHGDGQPGRPREALPGRRAEHDVGCPARRGQGREQHPGQVEMPVPALGQQHHPGRGEHDKADVTQMPGPGHRHGQRPEELDGDGDPERDTGERLVDREVHDPQGDAERDGDGRIGDGSSLFQVTHRPGETTSRDHHHGQGRRPQPQPGHRRGRNLPEQPVRQAGSELDRHDPDEDHDGGQHELPPARAWLDIPEMDYPGRCFYSHLKVRAARVIATAAQISSVTAFPTGKATPCCSTLRSPVDSAPVGSSSRTGRAPAGNLASGKITPPTPSSTM